MTALYRTTIVIWSRYEMGGELEEMAFQANEGDAYCSQVSSVLVDDPKSDPAWDGTEFFEPFDKEDEE